MRHFVASRPSSKFRKLEHGFYATYEYSDEDLLWAIVLAVLRRRKATDSKESEVLGVLGELAVFTDLDSFGCTPVWGGYLLEPYDILTGSGIRIDVKTRVLPPEQFLTYLNDGFSKVEDFWLETVKPSEADKFVKGTIRESYDYMVVCVTYAPHFSDLDAVWGEAERLVNLCVFSRNNKEEFARVAKEVLGALKTWYAGRATVDWGGEGTKYSSTDPFFERRKTDSVGKPIVTSGTQFQRIIDIYKAASVRIIEENYDPPKQRGGKVFAVIKDFFSGSNYELFRTQLLSKECVVDQPGNKFLSEFKE